MLVAGLSSPVAAWTPCEISFDEFGRMRFHCNLADLLKEYQAEARVEPFCCLKQPDLEIDQVDWEVFSGTAVVVNVDTLNSGDFQTFGHETVVAVTIVDPLGERASETQTIAVTEAPLGTGVLRRTQVGTIHVPNRTQEWFLTAAVFADPPTTQMPNGAVLEIDENNNTLVTQPCRILTSSSGPAGPIPCN